MSNECLHIKVLRQFLVDNKLEIWSEHEEDGWVNVYCPTCHMTIEAILKEKD